MAETRTPPPAARLLLCLAWLVPVVCSPLLAATTGTVEGQVLDVEAARPLAGVQITLGSGGLPGQRVTVTDAEGRFHFPNLPPGIYLLLATKPGYIALEQTEIQVEIEHTVTLTLEAFTVFDDEDDEVMITGAAPVLDVTSAAVGERFGRDHFDRVPTDRSLRDVPARTAGVVPAGAWTAPVSIAGGAPGDNVVRLDGLDVTGLVSNQASLVVPWDQVAQMEVSSGGRDAGREGSFGGIVQLLTRRGGPELHGRLSVYGQSAEAAASPPSTVSAGFEQSPDAWDAGVAVGGPAAAKRLWYFAALRDAVTERRIHNRQAVRFDEERETLAWTGRLTWQPSERHLLSVGSTGDPTDVTDEPLRDAAGRLGHDGELGDETWSLSLESTLGRRVFLEVLGGRFEETFKARPLADVPLYEDLTSTSFRAAAAGCGPAGRLGPGVAFTPGCLGGSVVRDRSRATRHEAAATLSWYSGEAAGSAADEPAASRLFLEHAVRFGFDARRGELYDDTRFPGAAPGPFFDDEGTLVDPDGLSGQRWQIGDEVARLFELEGVGRREHDEVAMFVEDRVRFGEHAVLRLGLRAERMDADLRVGEPAGPQGAPRGAPRLSFGFADTVSPRLSLVWDLDGNGRSRFFAHFGRYVDPRPPSVDGFPLASRRWNVYTFVPPADGSLPTAEQPGELILRRSVAAILQVAPDLKPPAVTEARVGFALEPLPDVTIGVSAVVRNLKRVVEDVSLDGGETYILLNPGGTLTENPATGEPLPNVVFFPRPSRDYRSFEVRIDKGFGNAWQLHGSYTFAESEGNYGSEVPPPDGSLLTPGYDTRFDLPSAVPRGDGALVGDRRHQWRLYGSWQWASKITTGLYGRYLSGAPVSRLAADSALGRRSRFVGAANEGGWLPELWGVDLHLEYPVETAGVTLELVGDVFNLTNRDTPVRVVEEWSLLTEDSNLADESAQTQPAFGSALEYQQPRIVRLGMRLRW